MGDWLADVIGVLAQAGGYAVLCGLMLWQLDRTTTAHREEVERLAEVIRGNTSAISGLMAALGAGTGGLVAGSGGDGRAG